LTVVGCFFNLYQLPDRYYRKTFLLRLVKHHPDRPIRAAIVRMPAQTADQP
jgi:hypothetical protein